ncbi:dihydrolipoyl dehydrogenase [Stratiformator vulcanicus]|uniref:Dihydrolipoyl dehydrogenase n=1 Tax=Stratiformator vulcanicus TaxID=2527980 RepID=A0A517R012_9PLAN|nr:dihydrolipoyl dehydrogenase [Stratiformator vulcanicus]QDT37150.1 Dihydrolipoyl dehydrogenase [Stratiformator vulcanicus]
MAQEFKLPQVSEGVEEADISEIMVAEGDTISPEQTIMEVETEKAVAPVECPFGGTISKIHVSEGDTVKVGDVLITVEGGEGESEDGGDSSADTSGQAQAESKSGQKPAPQPSSETEVDSDAVDLVVLGGGPGGYPAAFDAADHGLKVVMVDENIQPGGTCLRVGCIPSKTLLHVAKLIHEAEEAKQWGLTFGEPKIDLDRLRGFKTGVVDQLTGGISQLGKGRGVEIIQARGTFVDSNTLSLTKPDGSNETLKFKKCILATGSVPAMPSFFDIGDERVMNSTGALELKDVPAKLLVVGGGYIGLEMGSVYGALGSEVSVVEMTDGLLPGADRDLVKPLQQKLAKEFAAINLNTKVESLEATKDGIKATFSGEAVDKGADAEQVFDRVLIAIGRRPTSKGIGLENTRVETDDKGFAVVDKAMRTSDPNILAIGDVAGEPMLAHKATREARIAVETLLGHSTEFDNVGIPAVVFTDPELAWVGITEAEAKAAGRKVKVSKFPWAASGRAQTIDRIDGLTKLVCDPETDRILGVGIVGANAGELIAEGTLAVEMGAVAEDLAATIHAHPTLSETLMESGEGVGGQATHYYRPKR